jgi:predicted GIY-YIG superfamily endonuclease
MMTDMIIMVWIYVLSLEQDKYYVGKTVDMTSRIREHLSGRGSAWTQKYPYVKIIEQFEGDDLDEDKTTVKYMRKYGIDNVRGGTFCQVRLDEAKHSVLRGMIQSQTNGCFSCGDPGHFVRDCPRNYRTPKAAYHSDKRRRRTSHHQKNLYGVSCYNCGKYGHISPDCNQEIYDDWDDSYFD